MAKCNQYPGYVKLPMKKLYNAAIRLDFNGHIAAGPERGTAKLGGFSLRMFTLGKDQKDEQPEISIMLRPEEWLDLIDAMKEEFEAVSNARKEADEL